LYLEISVPFGLIKQVYRKIHKEIKDWTGGIARVVEYLPSKPKVLSSNSSIRAGCWWLMPVNQLLRRQRSGLQFKEKIPQTMG
jgi:hypothetical protein